MENYNQMSESRGHRHGNHFLYASTNSCGFGTTAGRIQNDSNINNNGGSSSQMDVGGSFHGQCLQSSSDHASIVKTEYNKTALNLAHKLRFSFQGGNVASSSDEDESIKAKIIAHPQYSSILEAYMDCQKVIIQKEKKKLFLPFHILMFSFFCRLDLWWQIGAPPEVVTKMEAVRQELESRHRSSSTLDALKDPELDQFMVLNFFFLPLPLSRKLLFYMIKII